MVSGEDTGIEIPDEIAEFGDSQPTCVRKLLGKPVALVGSGGNVEDSATTEFGVSVEPGKIVSGVGLENGVVLAPKSGPPPVWRRSSSFES